MEVDTGASVSIISERTYNNLKLAGVALKPTDIILCTYTGEILSILGTVDVDVQYESQTKTLSLIIVKGHGPSLFWKKLPFSNQAELE